MTAANCGSVSALTLGLPANTAVSQAQAELPKAMFYAKGQISAKLKQRFTNDLESISMLAILTPSNTGLAPGERIQEILVIGLLLAKDTQPVELVDHIAHLRPSGILFACVRPSQESAGDQECALAVRRALPTKPGHPQQFRVYMGPWQAAKQVQLTVNGENLDQVWESCNAQIILGSSDGVDLDQRISRRAHLLDLQAQEAKLTKDHARAKNTQQRNELYAKLHKLRAELQELQGQA